MDKKLDDLVTDTYSTGIPAFSDQIPMTSPLQGLFDSISCQAEAADDKNYSLELLDCYSGMPLPAACSNNIFDLLRTPPPPSSQPAPSPASTPVPESSEVVNTPPSPNSLSLSSSSNEAAAANDDQESTKTVEQDDKPTKKQNKPKKKNQNQKRQREARIAFMTKSEVDHLDDGYRWRKYGQKAVKNSNFPRSYYRCTTASCGVKKRVERWCEDPSVVVTTYEGTHTHPCPIKAAGTFGIMPPETPTTFLGGGAGIMMSNGGMPQIQYPQQPYFQIRPTPSPLSGAAVGNYHSSRSLHSNINMVPLIRDHGLLQDMVPSKMVKLDHPKEEQ